MKKNAQDTLTYLIDLLTLYLGELEQVTDCADQQFVYGEKTAYLECLEVLAQWENAEQNGLDFIVEERYPLT